MKLQTTIDITPSPWKIGYEHTILMLGSCFVDAIAKKMGEYYFRVISNPTGTLYNPVSIARHIDEPANADVAVITFGTAWVYEDRKTGMVVDNCQKRPATDFTRRRLSVEEIVALWQPIIDRYPDKRFIFTVSPIRHVKDGLHENQLSKATLLMAIEQLNRCAYFPSYEILLDELRDYRFYADDLVHPSSMAVNYIWERFEDAYFSPETRKEMQTLHALWLDRHHTILHPDTPEAQAFLQRVEATASELARRYPWLSNT
jgi:hypothetical protein